jgi:prepilin-type N-terminal cleavage/methylation domain-containing protein
MKISRSSRGGFTLPEVLVTVAIVAVLAAVVVPTVTQQISKGDDTNFQTNIATLRTGMTAFVSDVRKFPSRLQNIFNPIADADLDLDADVFGAAAAARWRGPYQAGGMIAHNATARTDSLNFQLAFAIDSLTERDASFAAGDGYLTLILGGVATTAAAERIDSLIDNNDGNNAGNLRWTGDPPDDARLFLRLIGSR